MSRSLGDSVAHSVGVSTNPEFLDYMVSAEDIALVIASDGVWEVLSNETVAKITKAHHIAMQAELCSNLIIQSAADLWIKHQPFVDDITVLVLFFDKNLIMKNTA